MVVVVAVALRNHHSLVTRFISDLGATACRIGNRCRCIRLFRAQRAGRDVFFVSRGRVEVTRPDGHIVAVLSDVDFFGEIALLEDKPGTASIARAEVCAMKTPIGAREADRLLCIRP